MANLIKNKQGWVFNKKDFVDSWLSSYHIGEVTQADFYSELKAFRTEWEEIYGRD